MDSQSSFDKAQQSWDNASDEPRYDEGYVERKAENAEHEMDIARDDAALDQMNK
jgi:hypothetical protein